MLYHIDDEHESTAPNATATTGDLTAVGVASVANAAAACVIASATTTGGNTGKESIKAGSTKTVESPTSHLPERIQPGVNILLRHLKLK